MGKGGEERVEYRVVEQAVLGRRPNRNAQESFRRCASSDRVSGPPSLPLASSPDTLMTLASESDLFLALAVQNPKHGENECEYDESESSLILSSLFKAVRNCISIE